MRIVKTRYKVVYIAAGLLVIGFVTDLLQRADLNEMAAWWGAVATTAFTVLGVRTFRVREEDIAAPRPLWRVTGRPTAGFLLGGLNIIGAAASIWSLVYGALVAPQSELVEALAADGSVAAQIFSIVVEAALGVWYLRSSIRLSRRSTVAVV